MNHNEIHLQLTQLVQTERKITQQILDLINQCELSRTYARLGYSSMFEYLHKGLGYSEGSAQRRLSSARLLRELPEIKSDLQNGNLNLTQVAMAQTAIRKEEKVQSKKIDLADKKEILSQLKNKNTFQSKAVLVEALSSYAPDEKNSISPIKDNQVQITLTLSQEQYEELKEAQDYLSNKVRSLELKDYLLYLTKKVLQQKGPVKSEANTSNSTTRQTAASANTTHPDLSASTAINTTAISAARTTLDKEQPLEKRKTIVQMQVVSTKNLAPDKAKELEQQQLLTEATAIPAADLVKVEEAEKTETLAVAMEVGKSERALVVRQRPYISKSLKAEVFRAADFQCQYVCKDSQKRCEATNFLQVDHIQPIALDGTNSKDNLRVYCQADNHLAAVESGLMKAV